MAVLGLLLLLLGVVVMIPSGATPGSSAHRVVRLPFHIEQTPGHQPRFATARQIVVRVLIGVAMIAGGMILLAIEASR